MLQTFSVPVDVGVWTTIENRPNVRNGRENRHRGLPAHQGKVTESKAFQSGTADISGYRTKGTRTISVRTIGVYGSGLSGRKGSAWRFDSATPHKFYLLT